MLQRLYQQSIAMVADMLEPEEQMVDTRPVNDMKIADR
jgi:hypothetical protein